MCIFTHTYLNHWCRNRFMKQYCNRLSVFCHSNVVLVMFHGLLPHYAYYLFVIKMEVLRRVVTQPVFPLVRSVKVNIMYYSSSTSWFQDLNIWLFPLSPFFTSSATCEKKREWPFTPNTEYPKWCSQQLFFHKLH